MSNNEIYRFGNWIRVEDGRPNDEEEVIVSICDDSGDTKFCYTSVGWRSRNILGKNAWVVDNTVRSDVVAWMPLPEPY